MNHILICLVGDQTVPNVLLIKDAAFQQIDTYIFITTELMETRKRLQHIINATGLKANQFRRLIVKADDLQDVKYKLDQLELPIDNTTYDINLTSGTKLMSIAVYSYFTQGHYQHCSGIFYTPIGKNAFIQSYPEHRIAEHEIKYCIPIDTYLTCYGINIDECKSSQSLYMPFEYTVTFLQAIYSKSKKQQKKLFYEFTGLRHSYNPHEELTIPITPSPALSEFLIQANYPIAENGQLNEADILYLIGGWFEEWTFHYIKQQYNLQDNEILCNVSISRHNEVGETVMNECDVLFTYQNTLHVVECKTGLSQRQISNHFNDVIYKLNTLKNEFGQRVNAEFYTLTSLREKSGQLKSFVKDRSRLYRIKIRDWNDLVK